ncbi:MAG: phage major capsid protein [Clostridiales bacterium]
MSYIPRSNVEALMPEEFQREIVENVPEMSAVMRYAYRGPNMSRAQKRIPVLSILPTAYFTNPGPGDTGDAGYKRITQIQWENKYIDAEELNVIVAIPEAVFDDADYNIWDEAKPKLLEAFGLAFDQAVFYGINAPAVWPTNIVAAATGAGNFVTLGSLGDIYNDIMAEGGVISKVEEDGFMVDGHVAATSMKARLRSLRDSAGNPIFKALYKEGVQGATRYELDGEQMFFPRNGAIIPTRSLLISGEWKQLVYAIRKDVTWKILTESVIQDPVTGAIVINLAQQNMIALRASMRIGWQVPNPINRLEEDEEERYPFAVLGPAGS